jgi:muramidase (phage lysozyme)
VHELGFSNKVILSRKTASLTPSTYFFLKFADRKRFNEVSYTIRKKKTNSTSPYSVIYYCRKSTDVSKEHGSSTFRIEE